jgi:hypothetical protein
MFFSWLWGPWTCANADILGPPLIGVGDSRQVLSVQGGGTIGRVETCR